MRKHFPEKLAENFEMYSPREGLHWWDEIVHPKYILFTLNLEKFIKKDMKINGSNDDNRNIYVF